MNEPIFFVYIFFDRKTNPRILEDLSISVLCETIMSQTISEKSRLFQQIDNSNLNKMNHNLWKAIDTEIEMIGNLVSESQHNFVSD